MRIVHVLFNIDPGGGSSPLYHVELDTELPPTARVLDIIELEPSSYGTRFELHGVRSPPSKFCTLRPIGVVEVVTERTLS